MAFCWSTVDGMCVDIWLRQTNCKQCTAPLTQVLLQQHPQPLTGLGGG